MTRRTIYLLLGAVAVLAVAGTLSIVWLLDAGDGASPSDPGTEPAFEAAPFRVGLSLSPETPRVGDNVLTLVLQDLQRQPVSGASIAAVAEMPAMGAMPAMQAPAQMLEIEPGVYRGTFAPSMTGSWPLTLEIAKDGMGEARISFDLATGREGFQLASGAVPLRPPQAATTGGASVASNQGATPSFQSGPFRLGVTLSPETPRVGENVLTLLLSDGAARSVSGASIEAVAEMPAMGAMPAMRAPADMLEIEPGVYRGTFAPSMAGSWPLTLRIAKEGLGDVRVSFDLATGREGFELASGAVPLDRNEAGALAANAGAMPGMSGPPDRRQESEAEQTASFRVDSGWQQAIGVRTAPVGPRQLTATIRLPGRVSVDETRLVDVNLRTAGWIEQLLVEETGQYVAAGQKLLDLYSPDLVTAQRDLLLAIDGATQLVDSPSAEARARTEALVDASRRRLRRLGLTATQVDGVIEGGQLHETLPILSPSNGYVLEKMAVQGMRVEPGMRLFRIADLSTVWVLADVYEGDAAFAEPGLEAVFSLAYASERSWRGRVDYVYPTLDRTSRSIRVRFVFSNAGLQLRPEMYGDLVIRQATSTALAIPAEAVLDLGTRRVVFVDLGEGRLQAREVALGPEAGGWYPVRAGLSDGELVVVSGNFLIDAESKVRGVVPLPLDGERALSSAGTDASGRASEDRR